MLPVVALCGLLATGCLRSTSPSVDALLENPLFAERYAEELVNSMVEMKIQDDPILVQPGKEAMIDQFRMQWRERADEAKRIQREGRAGFFVPVEEYVKGEVLFRENTLYVDSLFEVTPGPALRVYFTTAVDPRDTEFPDESAVDLGVLKSPYGTQQYRVPKLSNPIHYRTIVLWDTELERLYGFAQISTQN